MKKYKIDQRGGGRPKRIEKHKNVKWIDNAKNSQLRGTLNKTTMQ